MVSNSSRHCSFTKEMSLRSVKTDGIQIFKRMVLSFRYPEIKKKQGK